MSKPKTKPFNLELALRPGARVVTAEGAEVTQLTLFDAPGTEFTLVGVVAGWGLRLWTRDGRTVLSSNKDLCLVDERVTVPISAEDCPRFVRNRLSSAEGETHFAVLAMSPNSGVVICQPDPFLHLTRLITWEDLLDDQWEYSRDGSAWLPCSKETEL